MEAVPRLPMVSFQLKVSPEPTSFGPKLKQYIRDFYNEDPESYTNEIYQLENLRATAVRPPIAVTGCSLLKKYYCQLHFVQSRFPMGTDEPAAVSFSWRDTYANMIFTLSNIRFEIITILYNIGAIHTQLGAKTERTSADGMKMACSHFQCAAWAFEHLQNSYPQPPGVDMTPDLMKFMHQLCLAQAQECILEKSMLDNRKPTIVAKVAKQIVDYYALALWTLEPNNSEENPIAETVGSKIYKSWKNYVKFKRSYHMSVTYLYQGLAAEEQQKMGERVAFYNAALASLNTAKSLHLGAKGSTGITGVTGEKEAIEDALVFTNDVIEGKKKGATNENDFIYHEEVPDKDSLPTVNGASLVKGISFNVNDPEVSGPDIFARLVPMKVHEASSLYSEEKAKILRSVGEKIEEKNQVLETYLASLKLQHLSLWDPDLPTNDEYLSLPEELVERCAAINAKPNTIRDLEDVMAKLSTTYGDVETMLKDTGKLLKAEEQKEKQYQEAVGKRPPTIVATDLTREAKKYEEAHAKASESNQTLHRAMNLHLNNLQILAQPLNVLMASIPSSGSIGATTEQDKQNVRELKRILNKVEQMQRQRSELHSKLRDSISQDNLTRILVTATAESAPLDAIFAEQLEKHQSLVNLIDQNLSAQENVLTALTDAYAKTAETRKSVEDIIKRRELMISSLIASYDAYEDLLAKSSKGLEFYRKLEVNVTKLLQRVKSTCRVQEEEREQILARNDKQPNVYSNEGVSIVSVVPPSGGIEKKAGSGMKLRDHLANRLKNNPTYQSSYSDKHSIPVAPVQPNTHTKTYSLESTLGSDGMPVGHNPVASVPPMDPQQQDPQNYSYAYNYPGYYPPKKDHYQPHQYSSYDSSVSTGYMSINQSLPRSGTTNTDNMYHQAGGAQATDVSSDSTAYAGYSNMAQYPSRGYDEQNYNQYHQGYHAQNTQMPSQPIPNVYQPAVQPQAYVLNNFGQYQSPSHSSVATVGPQQPTHAQEATHMLPNVIPQQSEATTKNQNPAEQTYVHPYRTDSPSNYSTQQTIPPVATGSYSTLNDTMGAQYMTQNPQQNLPSSHVANSSYITPEQYPGSTTQSIPGSNSPQIEQNQQYYSNNTLNNQASVSQPSNYVAPTQQYTDPNQSNVAPATQSMQMNQIYPSAYGQSYNSMAPQTGSGGFSKEPDIIQSHAKPTSNIQGSYAPGYQYSIQPHNTGIMQTAYPNYTQGYSTNWQGQQQAPQMQHNSLTDSYKGHPGYSFDAMAGGYQYSSGYQDSNIVSERPPIPQQSNGHPAEQANSHYTSANNAATTNSTPSSQYLNGTYPAEINEQNYYATPYSVQQQPYSETSTVTSNPTNSITSSDNKTTTTNLEEKKVDKPKSNLDLLADLDITINHAPLVPEVNPIDVEKIMEKIPGIPDKTESNATNLPTEELDVKSEIDTIATHVDDKKENLQIVWDTWYNDVQPKRDPLGDPLVLQKFITDIEKYEKFVDSLTVKTLSGSTNLDIKWKEVRDFEEREFKKQRSSVSQLHSSDNRTPDWIPYDSTRVQLSAGEESPFDYINASHVKDLTQWTPSFIVTQAPMPKTFEAFWTMIWEQGSEVIASLSNDTVEEDIYWPRSQEAPLVIGNFTLTLMGTTNHTNYIQRVVGIRHSKQKIEKVAVHMQFLVWPASGLPGSPGALLSFATDIMSEQALRHCPKPIVIHCNVGGPLSALFLLAAATVCHVRAGHGVVDVPLVFSTLVKYRRCLIDKDSLLFGYRMVLYHAQDILMKRGILSSTRTTFDGFDGIKGTKGKPAKKNQHCHPSDDFLHNLGVGMQGIARQQANEHISGPSQVKAIGEPEEKTERVKPVDPLSQLDPLWSIRR